MGTNSLPIDHRMKYQIVLLALTLVLLVTEAQANNKKDVKCKNKRGSFTEKTITLNAKETLKFETRGNKYSPDLSCAVEYVLGSCKQASISCPMFKGDEKRYCGDDGPKNFKPDGDFSIIFESDSDKEKGKGWGVGCTVSCADSNDENSDDNDGGDETKKCNCGLASRKKRIVGGKETEVSEYPWQIGMVHTGKSSV